MNKLDLFDSLFVNEGEFIHPSLYRKYMGEREWVVNLNEDDFHNLYLLILHSEEDGIMTWADYFGSPVFYQYRHVLEFFPYQESDEVIQTFLQLVTYSEEQQ